MTILKAPENDLTHINSLKQLRMEKIRIKERIKHNETALRDSLQQLPAETFKTILRRYAPSFITGIVLNRSSGFVNNIFSFLGSKKTIKKEAIDREKKPGVFNVLKALFNFWKRKK